jgi:ureidoglycolate lyase
MVALGETVDFGVFIHENGIPNEDCQETYIYPGMTIEMGLASNCSSRRSRL